MSELATITKTENWDGNNFASVRSISERCGLNFLTEAERIRTAAFAAGKFRDTIAPRDMWLDVSVVPSWLKMAPIEPGSQFDSAAQSIISQFKGHESSEIVLRFEDLGDPEKVLQVWIEQARQKKKLEAELEATKLKAVEFQGKAETLDKVVECKEGDTCMRYAYKTLGVNHMFKTERDFVSYIETKLKWFYRPGGKTGHPVAYKQYIMQGLVSMRKTDPDPNGRTYDQFVITQRGFVYLKDLFFNGGNPQKQLI